MNFTNNELNSSFQFSQEGSASKELEIQEFFTNPLINRPEVNTLSAL
jgi:hypothetical protein